MYKHLSNFVKILMLMVVLFLSEGDVMANGIPSPEVGRQLTDSKSPTATTPPKTPTQEKGYVDKIVELSAPAGSVLATLFPSTKNCNYARDTQYQPFSGIDKTFPGAESLGVTEVTDKNGTEEKGKKVTCINVSGGTEGLLKMLFTMLISIIIIMSVINISVSGIQYMTEEATGKISGGAKKRLQNSFVALGLGLMSYAILYTVNKQLVAFNFDPSSIDKDGSIDKGKKAAADAAAKQNPFSTAFGSIDALSGPSTPGSPYAGVPGSQPTFAEITTQSNFSTLASFGSIKCSGARCSSSKPTVFGYKDGDGTVGSTGDNGIGNASWSTKPGCTYDTGNTVTLGVALPQGFWRAAFIPTADVKYLGIKVFINGIAQRILPIVDDSQTNLDFTFAAAKAYLDPTITNSNRINTSGKDVTFEIIKDYYKTNPKTDIVWTSNKSTFKNKYPCTK